MATTTTVGDLMTRDPIMLEPGDTVLDAACAMRDRDIGTVLITDKGQLVGVLTDRDIVVRAIADRGDAATMKVEQIASKEVAALAPDDPVDKAVQLMRSRALRRFPVVKSGKPVGVLSMGDLAVELDPKSALADVSAANPNR